MGDFDKIMKGMVYKSWMVLLFAAAVTAVVAYISYFYIVPVYEAKASLYVMSRRFNDYGVRLSYDNIQVSRQMIKDYRELIKSERVTAAVIDELGLTGLTTEMVAGMINISPKNDSNVVQVVVADTNPERAGDIANSLSRIFINKVKELTNEDNLSIVDMAKRPRMPVKPNHKLNIVIAFMFSFLVGAVGVYSYQLLDKRVRTIEDVETGLQCDVIGVIPKMNIR